jgi:hypothetical protein
MKGSSLNIKTAGVENSYQQTQQANTLLHVEE